MSIVDYSKFPKGLGYPSFQIEYQKEYSRQNNGKTLDLNDKNVLSQMQSAYAGYNSSAPSTTTPTTTESGGKGIMGGLISGLQKMSVDQSGSFDPGELVGVSGVLGTVWDANTGKLKTFSGILSSITSAIGDGIVLHLEQQKNLQKQINTETGLTGELSEHLRSSITEAYPHAVRLGFSFRDISNAVSTMTAEMGRFRLLNEETMLDLAQTSRVYFDDMSEGGRAANSFQQVSMGARDALLAIQKAGKSSLELGLNAKATTATLVREIDKLNQYGFKNGIDGLNSMVQKAQSLKMNLNSAFTVADAVMDPTKAMEYAAQLQSIGGAFGTLGDPIKMMYDATNNVEDLQDSIIGASESLATYNSEQGRFEVTGANLRKAREMAQYLGMDYKELANLAVNAAQRTSAAADMMANGLTFKNDEDREFLTNLAQMKEGKMQIEIPKNLQEKFGNITSVALEDMTADQQNLLLKFREEFKQMSTEDIAKKQVNFVENINRDVNFLAALARVRGGQTAEKVLKDLADSDKITKESANLANSAANGIDGVTTAVQDGLKTLTNAAARNSNEAKPTEQKSVPVAEAEKAKAEAERAKTQAQQQTPQNTNINLNVQGNPGSDVFRRAIETDPRLADKFFAAFGSYTEPVTQ